MREFEQGWHRDPEAVAQNRLPAHGLGLPASAVCLDGEWQFRQWTGVPPDGDSGPFWASDADRSAFDVLSVPGSWVIQGGPEQPFGIPIYTNVIYPFDISNYPEIPQVDEGGDHSKLVSVPNAWTGQRVVLRLGAAESACEVWVNGEPIGTSTDSRLPAEFDVTDAIVPGEDALIALRLHRWTAATWIEDQDMWWMAGLHRSVHLYATPMARIADVVFDTLEIRRPTGDATAAANLEATVEVAVTLDGPVPERSRLVVEMAGVVVETTVMKQTGEDHRLDLTVVDPELWTAETPNLSELIVRLIGPDNVELDEQRLAVGIRTFDVGTG